MPFPLSLPQQSLSRKPVPPVQPNRTIIFGLLLTEGLSLPRGQPPLEAYTVQQKMGLQLKSSCLRMASPVLKARPLHKVFHPNKLQKPHPAPLGLCPQRMRSPLMTPGEMWTPLADWDTEGGDIEWCAKRESRTKRANNFLGSLANSVSYGDNTVSIFNLRTVPMSSAFRQHSSILQVLRHRRKSFYIKGSRCWPLSLS